MHILRFGIENFSCFREYTEVSFVSTSQRDSPDFRIPDPRVPYGILPALGVYGANAAGKSNLLAGLMRLRDLVRYSFFFLPDQRIPWMPWRLDMKDDAPPSRFDIDFVLDGIRWHYGFTHDADRFREEWLHRWPNSRRQVVFERETDADDPWYFGPSLSGEKVALAKATRRNSLFLSAAAQNNHPSLSIVHRAITTGIREESQIELSGYPVFAEGDPILEPSFKERVEDIVRAFDLGCSAIDFEEVPEHQLQPLEALERLLKPEAFEEVRRRFGTSARFKVVLERKGEHGEKWTLPPEMESRGTNILLQRINDLLALESGVLVIDELDTSLHPEVCAALLEIFTSPARNTRNAQLIFSTHNRDLMQKLRRDETILVEKQQDGSSAVFSVAEFKELRGREDRRQVYEEGRIGAVPILGTPDPWQN